MGAAFLPASKPASNLSSQLDSAYKKLRTVLSNPCLKPLAKVFPRSEGGGMVAGGRPKEKQACLQEQLAGAVPPVVIASTLNIILK